MESFRAWLEKAPALAAVLLEQGAGPGFGRVFQPAFL